MTIALFPGQGVQSPEMGRGLTDAAPEVFATASDVLRIDVAELCTQGRSGEADLNTTRWAQPAVLVCGVAAFEVLSRGGEAFTATVGHSVGEYAALVTAGALTLGDALGVITVRAEATDEAGRSTPGGMAAVMRVEREVVDRICAHEGVALAAENGPGQFVVSGPLDALKRTIEALAASGAVSRRLDVSAAFHSPVMASAADRISEALDGVSFATPKFDVWSPTTADVVRTGEQIRSVLIDQLTNPVRWREAIEAVATEHGPVFCDMGPGRVVAGLTRRIVKGAEIRTLDDLLVTTSEGAAE